MTNNVVQSFCILALNRACTVRFRVTPLCGDVDRTIEGEEVNELIDGTYSWIAGFDPTDALSVETSASILSTSIRNYLLPWFEKTDTCEKAYNEYQKFSIMSKHPNNIGFLLGMGNYVDTAKLLIEYILHSDNYNQHWWSLKRSEYQNLFNAISSNDTDFISSYIATKEQESMHNLKIRKNKKRNVILTEALEKERPHL